MIRGLVLAGVSATVVVLVLAVMWLAFRAPRESDGPVYAEGDVLPPAADLADAPSWWALGALSDARRRAADWDALAEFAEMLPLADAAMFRRLEADWDRVKNLGTRRAPADVGPHGGTGWALAFHAHQDVDSLDQDGRYLAGVSA